MVERLHPVLLSIEAAPTRVLHPSFPEFLLSSKRCEDPLFHVNPREQHMKVAVACLQRMNKSLQHIILDIETVPKMNSNIPDLDDRLRKLVPDDLQYACQYWIAHLAKACVVLDAKEQHPDLLRELSSFCLHKTSIWLEITSLLGALQYTLGGFHDLRKGLEVCKHLMLYTSTAYISSRDFT